MTGGAGKMAGWLWVVAFYALVLVAGIALVGGGTVLATSALEVLRSDVSWHLLAGIALMVVGVAAFVGGVILLFRITSIRVPGRPFATDVDASATRYPDYIDTTLDTPGGREHHRGGGHDGNSGGGN